VEDGQRIERDAIVLEQAAQVVALTLMKPLRGSAA
jgi:hypothetical protein